VSGLNRILTLYIAVTRARVVFSLRQAHQSLKKTERDHIRETTLCGLLPGMIFGGYLGIRVLVDGISTNAALLRENLTVSPLVENDRNGAFGGFFWSLCVSLVMMSLACYILWKVQRAKTCENGGKIGRCFKALVRHPVLCKQPSQDLPFNQARDGCLQGVYTNSRIIKL
jgi:hypothetical protein